MAKGLVLQIPSLERVDSTQRYLIDQLKKGLMHAPVAVTAAEQYAGKGSRENSWTGLKNNLFLSVARDLDTDCNESICFSTNHFGHEIHEAEHLLRIGPFNVKQEGKK